MRWTVRRWTANSAELNATPMTAVGLAVDRIGVGWLAGGATKWEDGVFTICRSETGAKAALIAALQKLSCRPPASRTELRAIGAMMNPSQFEADVRRIAAELFPAAMHGGASIVAGRERDGVYETEECVHIVEATMNMTKDKAEYDVEKTARLAQEYRQKKPTKAVKGWFICSSEPTAHQLDAVRRLGKGFVHGMSFTAFQQRLIDVAGYISQCRKHSFGSARNPDTDSNDNLDEYVEVAAKQRDSREGHNARELASSIQLGKRIILLGDYGTGKSMMLREIFRLLSADYYSRRTMAFPIYINLRDHQGQDDVEEILERHARKIGFGSPHHLVRAWRAGYVHLLLDGFDEFTPLGVQSTFQGIKKVRFDGMKAVRSFVAETPLAMGVFIAGREHFFDGDKDRRTALGTTVGFSECFLHEFSEEQVSTYLRRKGLTGRLPSWVPTRPLLIAHLASRRAPHSVVVEGSVLDDLARAEERNEIATEEVGWDYLLDRISEREARNEPGVDAETVRLVLERLANKARQTPSGLGPLSRAELERGFIEVTGIAPDVRAAQMLLRLPGLGVTSDDREARGFVDVSLANACAAGEVSRWAYKFHLNEIRSRLQDLSVPLDALGQSVLRHHAEIGGFTEKNLNSILIGCAADSKFSIASFDIARLIDDLGMSIFGPVYVEGADFPGSDTLEWTQLQGITFSRCFFSNLEVSEVQDPSVSARFENCLILNLLGVSDEQHCPSKIFSKCEIETYQKTKSTVAELTSMVGIPLQSRVKLTILKKVYLQAGGGRLEAALFRGLDDRLRQLVPDSLSELRAAGLVAVSNRGKGNSWHAFRSERGRVVALLRAPESCISDPAFAAD